MKKTGLITLIAIGFIVILFSGCGASNYFEDWEGPIKGYITFDENGNFTGFQQGNNPGDQTNNATCYIHEYSRSSPSAYISKQLLDNSDLEWKDDIGTEERIYFKKIGAIGKFTTEVGIKDMYFYCDDEYVYIINNREAKYGDKETRRQNLANYRIFVDMIGLRDLAIYMIDKDHI